MRIREAESSDAPAVLRLVSALLFELGGQPLPEPHGREAFSELLADSQKGFVLLGEVEAGPVAVCTVSHVHALRSLGQYSIIQEMYVAPPLRGTSVGTTLLHRALQECIRRESRFVELGTPIGGRRQEAFYKRSGFFCVGERLRWKPSA
jgi:GNAT superfamily N-acetyltransferase